MNGIPLTKKVKAFLHDSSIPYQAHDSWYVYSITLGTHVINLAQHPNCCSEVDVSSYGARLTDEEVDVLLKLLSLCSAFVRVTTRIASMKRRVKAPKGFKKLVTTVSGHGPSQGYVHFYHSVIGERV